MLPPLPVKIGAPYLGEILDPPLNSDKNMCNEQNWVWWIRCTYYFAEIVIRNCTIVFIKHQKWYHFYGSITVRINTK